MEDTPLKEHFSSDLTKAGLCHSHMCGTRTPGKEREEHVQTL